MRLLTLFAFFIHIVFCFYGNKVNSSTTPLGNGKYVSYEVLTASYPCGFTFMEDGRIIYLERFSGNIILFNETDNTSKTVFTVPSIVTFGESGLLGVAVHPDYPLSPFIYVYATRVESKGNENQILKIEIDVDNEQGKGFTKIFVSDKKAKRSHNGGRLMFRKSDKKLYVIIGDTHVKPEFAQDMTTNTGKLLRMNDDGSIPSDNPYPGKYIYAYGIRNSFGFNFDPINDNLWESENGPTCNDEINLISAGANYGWGKRYSCPNTNRDGKNIHKPKYYWPKNLPSAVGVAFANDSSRSLLVGSWNFGRIYEFGFNAARDDVKDMAIAYTHPVGKGSVVSLEIHPITSKVYFSSMKGIYRLEDKV